MTLAILALWFLELEKRRVGKKNTGHHPAGDPTFLGSFTSIGLAGTSDPGRWKNCGRLAVNGGRLHLSNTVNFRVLLGMLSHDLKMWSRLHEKGHEKLAKAYYTTMIDPVAPLLCYAA